MFLTCYVTYIHIVAYTSMAERIRQLVQDSVGDTLYDKALQCLKTFRSEAVTEDDEVQLCAFSRMFVIT